MALATSIELTTRRRRLSFITGKLLITSWKTFARSEIYDINITLDLLPTAVGREEVS